MNIVGVEELFDCTANWNKNRNWVGANLGELKYIGLLRKFENMQSKMQK